MENLIQKIFKNKKVNFTKLVSFGFEKHEASYSYSKVLAESGFFLTVTVSEQGIIEAEITDPAFNNEPYTLHLAHGVSGSFVGSIKSQYEETLGEISDYCFDPDIFKTRQAAELTDYVRNTYGDELEFLWQKFPDNAVWRRKDTKKWYAALLTVSKRKLGIDSDESAEIIDLRIEPEALTDLIDNAKYYPGYHMNKKHWYTIILDGSVDLKEICRRIDDSYLLARK